MFNFFINSNQVTNNSEIFFNTMAKLNFSPFHSYNCFLQYYYIPGLLKWLNGKIIHLPIPET